MQSDASAKGWYHSCASVALVPLHLFFFYYYGVQLGVRRRLHSTLKCLAFVFLHPYFL